MDRLTYRHEDQHGNPTNSISPALKFSYAHRDDWVKKVAVRLAAIEDILGDDYDLDRLRELVEADREGRCVVLPCKVGSKVYVTGRKKIVEAEVQEIYLDDREGMEMLVHFKCDTSCAGCPFNSLKQDWDGEWSCDGEYGDGCVFQREFGKTVFLTRKAAEAALKGEQNG